MITDRSAIPAFNSSFRCYSVGKLTFLFGRRTQSPPRLTDVAFHRIQVFPCSICRGEYALAELNFYRTTSIEDNLKWMSGKPGNRLAEIRTGTRIATGTGIGIGFKGRKEKVKQKSNTYLLILVILRY